MTIAQTGSVEMLLIQDCSPSILTDCQLMESHALSWDNLKCEYLSQAVSQAGANAFGLFGSFKVVSPFSTSC